mgnify:CR=1 FL=1
MKNKILIFGNGFIGKRLQESLDADISDKRISSFHDIKEEIASHKPKIIINCIGYTGIRNVDDCELDKNKTIFSNTFIPILMAEEALRNKIKLIHISSGCIYHYDYAEDKPIKEEKAQNFLDLYYSRTKIYAERSLEPLLPKANILIPRIRIPLDNRPHPRNILTKLINYKKIIDAPNSITYIPDFIQALKHLIKIDARGLYNVVNKGGLYYSELLDIYAKYVPNFKYKILDYKQLKLTRTNLILSTNKIERTGFNIRRVKEVLEECVRNYIKYS